MQIVSPELIKGKKVLLRLDIDVPIENGKILEPYRLESGLETLKLCLEHAESVTCMGHIGRPGGVEVPELSVAPVVAWFEDALKDMQLPEGKFNFLENLRFEKGEGDATIEYAQELAKLGDFFVMEAFASHRPSASTTVLPTLIPHAAGLRFAKEVEELTKVRENPLRPLVAVIGGAKIEDKLGVVEEMSKKADAVLIGGKLPHEIKEKGLNFPGNVLVARMNQSGFDLDLEVAAKFADVIKAAKQVVWAGPMGKYEDPEQREGTRLLAQAMVDAGVYSVIGGGDTITALTGVQMLDKMSFVSTGGGAMLIMLAEGTLPTIEALQ
jgi:phosphoglycerate kinase